MLSFPAAKAKKSTRWVTSALCLKGGRPVLNHQRSWFLPHQLTMVLQYDV